MHERNTGCRVLEPHEVEFVAGGYEQDGGLGGDGGGGGGGGGSGVSVGPYSMIPIPDGWRLNVPLDNSFSLFLDRSNSGNYDIGASIHIDDVTIEPSVNLSNNSIELKVSWSDAYFNYEIKLGYGEGSDVSDPTKHLEDIEFKEAKKFVKG